MPPDAQPAHCRVQALKKPQFRDSDPRQQLCVSPQDPRIHFALVCGARSCPPIKLYTPDNVDQGLHVRAPPCHAADRGHARPFLLMLERCGTVLKN